MTSLFPSVIRASSQAQVTRLRDGRLHLHHGPIDIILQAWGKSDVVADAESRAIARFSSILEELCAELPQLRAENEQINGPVARRMAAAVAPFRPAFITPMAAVAGAVADWVLSDFRCGGIDRAYANNGGDISVHLSRGQEFQCAIATGMGTAGRISITAESLVQGLATSGWGGRSWSLGIADSVTVLAKSAAEADAAATMIANAVDLPECASIERRPAHDLQADSDLGHRLVTVGVPRLSIEEKTVALNRGLRTAETFLARGLIEGAALFLQGESRITQGLVLLQ